jgi:ketosteroid isomerase-like protein
MMNGRGVLENHYKAWDAGDADAFVTDYAEDAAVIMPGIYRLTPCWPWRQAG